MKIMTKQLKTINNRIRAIIPCAGLGTRVGMSPGQSKELLYNKDGIKLINHVLDICRRYGFDPLIISRKEKKDLNKYIKELGHDLLIIKPEGEWQDTVLAGSEYWHDKNILILPDTEFETKPLEYLNEFFHSRQIVLFTHLVDDGNKWGCVEEVNKEIIIKEKPKNVKSAEAWGMIGFRSSVGEYLFNCLKKAIFVGHPHTTAIIPLTHFQDLTRNKDILKWQPRFK